MGLRFNLGKIPVVIRPAFFILCLLGAIGVPPVQGLSWAAVVLVSVLLHELGHAWTIQAFGYAPAIELHALGGRTSWPAGARAGHGQQLAVSLAGPGLQLALGGVVWLVSLTGRLDPWLVRQLLWVNIGWAVINLLPILPWDGGNALDSAIALKWGPRPKVVGTVSMVLGGGIVGLALLSRNVLLGYFGVMGMQQGWARFNYRPPTTADLIAAARSGQLPLELWPMVVERLMKEGHPEEVRDLFGRRIAAGAAVAPEDEQVAQRIVTTLFTLGYFAETADLCSRFFNETNHAVQAVNAACAFARLGQLDEAMLWLERAIAAGFTDRASLAQDEDLAPLRARPDFQALLTIRTA